MDIVLKKEIDGKVEEKRYVMVMVNTIKLRKTMEISKRLEKGFETAEELDELVDYLVDMYSSQFTRTELYEGLAVECLMEEVMNCVTHIQGKLMSKLNNIEGAEKNA